MTTPHDDDITGRDDITGHDSSGPDDSAGHDSAGHDDIVGTLGDYLDRGEEPPRALIEASAENQLAYAALLRVREAARTLVDIDEDGTTEAGSGWVENILANVHREVRAGRPIPVTHPSPRAALTLTEGAVLGLIRAAGDGVDGVLIGRCVLDGDVSVPGALITVRIEASVFWGESIPEAADRLRAAVAQALVQHTELSIEAVDVTVTDVHLRRTTSGGTDAVVDDTATDDGSDS